MFTRKILFVTLIFSLLVTACNEREKTISLPRSVPEAEGVSSGDILAFINAVENSKNELHSFMFLRHGKVIAEGWWNPYRPDLKHTLYSTSKSFTSTAAGFAVSEKLLSVNDKVVSFFPEYLPDTVSSYLAELTVKYLLTMSVGQSADPTFIDSRDSNWVRGFLAHPIVYEPGTKFLYNSMATYMVSAIVQRVTGQTIIDYLTPRLFKPLGIEGIDWETDPMGTNTGGWGLRLKTEDMAKFGQLYLQKGMWNGKQILAAEWIEEATSKKIEQAPDAPQSAKDSSDWLQGYCYQFWRSRHNAYRADGAYGQFIIIMPDQDAVIAITAETPDMQNELNLVWEYLLPAMKKEKLPANKDEDSRLKQKLSSLTLPVHEKTANSSIAATISDRMYSLEPNEKKIEAVTFQFADNICQLVMKTDTSTYSFSFGSGSWQSGQTLMPGPYLLSEALANRAGLPPFQIAGSYYWQDNNTLVLTLRYIESPHTETILCRFEDNGISLEIQNSFFFGKGSLIIKGAVL
jgi:CubicO group peptidase (beta-lactamase class C family)